MRAVVIGLLVIAPGLRLAEAQGLGPRTLLPLHVACANLPVAAAPAAPYRVDGAQVPDSRQALGPGDVAVVKLGGGSVAVGDAFLARRLDGGREPFRRGTGGYAGLRTVALLTVTAADERFALARVDRACAEVLVGDLLEPVVLPSLPAAEAPGRPSFDDRARVLFGLDLRLSFGDGDLLALDRGTAHGVAPGNRFGIYRDPTARRPAFGELTPGLPLIELGEAVVVEVAETTSKAIIVKAVDAIVSGDIAVRVPPARP